MKHQNRYWNDPEDDEESDKAINSGAEGGDTVADAGSDAE